jgi:AcrR family transcriptional regulator
MPKASQERRERAANEMRRTILDAAEHLLVQGGPDEVTIRKIAALLDYAPPSLYYYVADKEAVLTALADRHGAQVAQAMLQAVAGPQRDPLTRLRTLSQAYVEWALANPMFYLALFRPRLCKSDGEKCPSQTTIQLFDLFAEPIAHAQKQGRLRRDALPRQAAHTLWAGLHGLAHFQITQPGLVEFSPTLLACQIDSLLRGLRGS